MGLFIKRCKECDKIISQRTYEGPDKTKRNKRCWNCKNKTGKIYDGGLKIPILTGVGQ